MTPYEQSISALENARQDQETLMLIMSRRSTEQELYVKASLEKTNAALHALRSEASPLSDEVIAAGDAMVVFFDDYDIDELMGEGAGVYWNRAKKAWFAARSSTPAVPRVRVEEIAAKWKDLFVQLKDRITVLPGEVDDFDDLITAMLREGEGDGEGVAGNTPPVSSAVADRSVAEDSDQGLQPPDAPSREARNWPEDYDDDNGQYMHLCVTCRLEFMGHKHRNQCKVCGALQKDFRERALVAIEKLAPTKAYISADFLTYDNGYIDGYIHAAFFEHPTPHATNTPQT